MRTFILNNPNIKDNINDYYRSWVLRGNNPKFGSIKEKTDYENELLKFPTPSYQLFE